MQTNKNYAHKDCPCDGEGCIDCYSSFMEQNQREMLTVLKHIVASAPLTGLPVALENDIQDACRLIKSIEGK